MRPLRLKVDWQLDTWFQQSRTNPEDDCIFSMTSVSQQMSMPQSWPATSDDESDSAWSLNFHVAWLLVLTHLQKKETEEKLLLSQNQWRVTSFGQKLIWHERKGLQKYAKYLGPNAPYSISICQDHVTLFMVVYISHNKEKSGKSASHFSVVTVFFLSTLHVKDGSWVATTDGMAGDLHQKGSFSQRTLYVKCGRLLLKHYSNANSRHWLSITFSPCFRFVFVAWDKNERNNIQLFPSFCS